MPRNLVGKNKNKKGRRPQKRAQAFPTVCPAASDVYRGATIPRALNNSAIQVEDRIMTQIVAVTSNGSGTISFTNNTSPGSATEWSQYSARFIEYRTLSMRVRFLPNLQNFENTAGLGYIYGPLYGGIVRDTALTPPASAAASLAICTKVASIQRPMTIDWRMNGTPEANWLNTRVPAAAGYTYFTGFGLTPSITYGQALVWYLVQFRNRD